MNYETVMGDLKSFWEIVVDVWQQGIFGVQIGKMLTAAFIFIIFLMLRKIIATQIIKRVKSLADSAVTNFSAMTHRRIFWHIAVEYRATIAQLRRIRDEIEAYVVENDAFAKPHEVPTFVRIDRFSDSSIDIMLYCFTRTIFWGQWLEVKEKLSLKVKEIVEGAGTGFAFPSRSIYMSTPAGEAPEVFVPPSDQAR